MNSGEVQQELHLRGVDGCSNLKAYLRKSGLMRSRSEAAQLSFQNGVMKGWQKSLQRERPCNHCGEIFMAKAKVHRWCSVCAPTPQDVYRLHWYGMSRPMYDALMCAQNNACAICERHFGKTCYVDHDHFTGKARGLLCAGCNTMLAGHELPAWVERANAYLTKYAQKNGECNGSDRSSSDVCPRFERIYAARPLSPTTIFRGGIRSVVEEEPSSGSEAA